MPGKDPREQVQVQQQENQVQQQQQQVQQQQVQQQQPQQLQNSTPQELRRSSLMLRTPPKPRKSLREKTPSLRKKEFDDSH